LSGLSSAAPVGVVSADWWRREDRAPADDVPGSRLAYGALAAFTAVLLIAPQNVLPVLGRLRIALLTGTIAIIAHVWDRWQRGLPLTRPGREMTLAAALLGWAALSVPLSRWPGGSFSLLVDLYLKALLVFWLVASVVDTAARLRRLAWTLTVLAMVVAVVAIANYGGGVFGPAPDRIVGYDAGLTRNPNDLALMLNLIIPIGLSLLLCSKGGVARVVLVIALSLEVIAVVLTFSRAGFLVLAGIVGLCGWRLARRGGGGWVLAGLLVAALGLPFLPHGYTDRLLTLRAIDSDPTGSSQARWAGMLGALEDAAEHPILGAGVGMDILVLNQRVGPTWRAVHNAYLELAVDLGLPGLVLFVLLLRACLASARTARLQGGRLVASLGEGIEVSLIGFAVAALFHPVAYQFYFYYVGGLAVAARTVSAREGAALA
jgi:O-antigen ligase